MLCSINIADLALMKKAQIDFDSGLCVLTGETGAGKSVLLSAISLLAGSRAPKELVPKNTGFSLVEGVLYFADCDEIDAFLSESGANKCQEGQLVISRRIYKDKPSKCYVNGSFATLSLLTKLGRFWVDFHGSREPQKLLNTAFQLDMLDSYSGSSQKKRPYLELLRQRNALAKQAEELRSARKLGTDELEFINAQIKSLEALNPTDENIAEIEAKYKLASAASQVMESAGQIYSLLDGSDGVCQLLAKAYKQAASFAQAGDDAQSICDRIQSLSVEAFDIAQSCKDLADSTNMTAAEVESINAKMGEYLSLSRKYGASAENLREALESLKKKVAMQSNVKETLAKIDEDIAEINAKLKPYADEIFAARTLGAKRLQTQALSVMKKLGFKKPSFEIFITRQNEFDQNCGSVCEFMFSGNPGHELAPLAKVASSGEIARVMLSLKSCFAAADKTPLLVFDEVDSNVGGEIGAQVGHELKNLAKDHQVLCVTHLPQVAAQADWHLLVEKSVGENSTEVSIRQIGKDKPARVSELARMLGDRNSDSALAHAKELLENSL